MRPYLKRGIRETDFLDKANVWKSCFFAYKQPRCPSADKWIRKLWYIYTMEYYSAVKKNSFESVLMRWMKLEPIIQSEVSQKDKDWYSILIHMEFRKMVMITLYAKQKKRHRCTEQTFGLCGRRRGWDVSRGEHWNMYIIKGETDHQPRLDAWDKCSGLVHWGDPEGSGWRGRWEVGSGWGRHANPWLIHVNVWQKPLQYCKVISLQLIKINGKKKS